MKTCQMCSPPPLPPLLPTPTPPTPAAKESPRAQLLSSDINLAVSVSLACPPPSLSPPELLWDLVQGWSWQSEFGPGET